MLSAMGRPLVHDDEAIIEAAGGIFARRGYAAASMDAIAADAGTTKPTLYARFGAKHRLYELAVRAIAARLLEHLDDAYAQARSQASVKDLVDLSVRAYFDFFEDDPDAFQLLFSSEREEPAATIAEEVLEEITGRLTELVDAVLDRSGRHAPQRTPLIAAMLAGITDQAVRYLARHPEFDRELARSMASSFSYAAARGMDPTLLGDA
jgi:AcrR family transcriptional regulator